MTKRLTKIICTLGPASRDTEVIASLADMGMNVARLNMSHGDQTDHATYIERIREANASRTVPIGILLDTKGGEIRTGVTQEPLKISANQQVVFYPSSQKPPATTTAIEVGYDGFSEDAKETNRILIDNGSLSFSIDEIRVDGTVLATALEDGSIGSRRHINLPGADVDIPSITEKDWEDIAFAVEQNVDFIALSFIRTAEEVQTVRAFLDKNQSGMQIITKIETRQSAENITEILEVSDGIMIARGDLGAEVPFEELPALQDEIVVRCNDAGKPVIVATHMLESMKEYPIPTRAEMTDVAHAAATMADSTMLSGETASGRHPAKVVEAMHRILCATEEHLYRLSAPGTFSIHDEEDAKGEAAVRLTKTTKADAIMVFTRTGNTAKAVSKFRPRVPIVACTPEAGIQQQLSLPYGVQALLVEFGKTEQTVQRGVEAALQAGLLESGNRIIVVSDVETDSGSAWSVQYRTI